MTLHIARLDSVEDLIVHGFPALPATTPLTFLKRITNTVDWNIRFVAGSSERFMAFLRDVDFDCREAVIEVSCCFRHTPQSLARTIAHELMELETLEPWYLVCQVLSYVPDRRRSLLEAQLRDARDSIIERRLARFPYWGSDDSVALPRGIPGWT